MRLPSGATVIPWIASTPPIWPTTLFVAGSMMWITSPAKLVWMILNLDCCADSGDKASVQRAMPARAARPVRNNCLVLMFVILLFRCSGFLAQHECSQRLPRRVLLRFELLAAAMMRIATGFLRERMMDQRAVQAARYGDLLDQLEVLPRLRFCPSCGSGRQRHQVEGRVVLCMANDTARMAGTFGREHRLHFALEEVVVQRGCSGFRGRSRRARGLAQRRRCRHGEAGRGDDIGRGPPHIGTSRENWLISQNFMPEPKATQVPRLRAARIYLSKASATTWAGSVGVPTVKARCCLPFAI